MKKKRDGRCCLRDSIPNLFLKMKLLTFFTFVSVAFVTANSYSQETKFNMEFENATIGQIFRAIEKNSEFIILYSEKSIDVDRKVSLNVNNETVTSILNKVFKGTLNYYEIYDRQIAIMSKESMDRPSINGKLKNSLQELEVTGTVTDVNGQPLPGVNVVEKGTTNGAVTNLDGEYTISVGSTDAILSFSFVGFLTEEIEVNDQTTIDITMVEDITTLDEVVVIGYGTQKKKDLTGSIATADLEVFKEQSNVSILQSLHGSVPGLNIGQVDEAGEEASIQIRGRTSISGALNPLIVLDGVIYRGNMNDLNPNDISSISVLKDASAAAIYGSQAANGVIEITTKRGKSKGKPVINISSKITSESPTVDFSTGSPDNYLKRLEIYDIKNSRTEESGYLEKNPGWDPSTLFKTTEERRAYDQGRTENWYDLLTRGNSFTQQYDLSFSQSTDFTNYYISTGYTKQLGAMILEGYERFNARINLDFNVTDWLTFGVQSSFANSSYLGPTPDEDDRFIAPFATAYDENGEVILQPAEANTNNLIKKEADYENKRLNFFGNFYGEVAIPYIQGLKYRGNFATNYVPTIYNEYLHYVNEFLGSGNKVRYANYDWITDHILSYDRMFSNLHDVEITMGYGAQERNYDYTSASASNFQDHVLGFNNLESGLFQTVNTEAWNETSLYQMARVFYGYANKYLLTGTIRRDGFSGFGEDNKFGLFPSLSLGWVASEEKFISNNIGDWLEFLKFRFSYGENGNRTIERYQTLPKVESFFGYVNESDEQLLVQEVTSMASSNLKWETTTGMNIGLDFSAMSGRISGNIDYYNNNTTDLLYSVDIPSINKFGTVPANLGKIHNHGIEIILNTVNLKRENWQWNTSFVYSRNRNELKELLGIDADGDGKEDDLISEGLFVGEPLSTIYAYAINGIWQVDDDVPSHSDIGAYRIVDYSEDGEITPDDRHIIGYEDPAYRFSMMNEVGYKNWMLRVFVNSIQGGKDRYMAPDEIRFDPIVRTIPADDSRFDYWAPENPDARYQRDGLQASITGQRYAQRNFVRLQNVSLSYTLPKTILNKLKIENLKIYVSGRNLFTWTKWNGWDPETGTTLDEQERPVMREYTVGLDFSF